MGKYSRACFAPAILVAVMVLAAEQVRAASYTFEPRHTEVRFACSIGLGTQRGRFTRVDGEIDYEPAAPDRTKVAARVATASLTTGEPLMDETLKGSDFFNVSSFPRMSFVSRSVRATGTHTAVMNGDMTVNGITRPVNFSVSIAPEQSAATYRGKELEFVARTHVRRSAFNMTAFQSMASDDVTIEIDAVLRKKP